MNERKVGLEQLLLGVRERVQILDGLVRVRTGVGQGFELEVELPE